MREEELVTADGDRTSRLRKVPWLNLEHLQNMLFVIIGAGMNGSQLALTCATLGIKEQQAQMRNAVRKLIPRRLIKTMVEVL